MDLALQNAVSEADHKTLAEHYEAAAQEMRHKVDEYKKLLAQYESKSYLYGRQAGGSESALPAADRCL